MTSQVKDPSTEFRQEDARVYAPAAIPDYEALRACWMPVAYSNDIGDKPYATRLLNEQIVLWRDKSGHVRAVADLCIHRGTALSRGTVAGDEIVCPYHGWRFDGTGRCTMIPQRENPRNVPSKAKVPGYHALERYGIIWVAMDTPRFDLPEVPEFSNDNYQVLGAGPYEWAADASRAVENFTDFAHFPWVHEGWLGDAARVEVGKYEVEVRGNTLHYQYDRPEANNTEEYPVFGGDFNREAPIRHSTYELHLPYIIVLRHHWDGTENHMVHIYAAQPVTTDKSIGFLRTARNYGKDQTEEMYNEFATMIMAQDQRMVESQRPEHVPFDLADELHLDFDKVAVNYRKLMRDLGLAKRNQADSTST